MQRVLEHHYKYNAGLIRFDWKAMPFHGPTKRCFHLDTVEISDFIFDFFI